MSLILRISSTQKYTSNGSKWQWISGVARVSLNVQSYSILNIQAYSRRQVIALSIAYPLASWQKFTRKRAQRAWLECHKMSPNPRANLTKLTPEKRAIAGRLLWQGFYKKPLPGHYGFPLLFFTDSLHCLSRLRLAHSTQAAHRQRVRRQIATQPWREINRHRKGKIRGDVKDACR